MSCKPVMVVFGLWGLEVVLDDILVNSFVRFAGLGCGFHRGTNVQCWNGGWGVWGQGELDM